MSNHIEWIDADAAAADMDWSITKGEFTDAFGTVNDGSAVTFGNVVLEGTVAELEDFLAHLQAQIFEIKDALSEQEEDG